MRKRPIGKYTTTELIVEYARAAEEYGRSMSGPNYKWTNKEAKIIANCYRELRSRGTDEQMALLNLLDGDNGDYVRCWVGTHALEFAPEIGERVLSELVEKSDFVGFIARQALEQWKAGELNFS